MVDMRTTQLQQQLDDTNNALLECSNELMQAVCSLHEQDTSHRVALQKLARACRISAQYCYAYYYHTRHSLAYQREIEQLKLQLCAEQTDHDNTKQRMTSALLTLLGMHTATQCDSNDLAAAQSLKRKLSAAEFVRTPFQFDAAFTDPPSDAVHATDAQLHMLDLKRSRWNTVPAKSRQWCLQQITEYNILRSAADRGQ